MTVKQDSPLATFVDPLTMVHVREYPHPVELVWEAVTTSEHLDVWLLPVSRVERRLGGTCSFSWGGQAEASRPGTVTEFDPPRAVRYSLGGGYLRFELEPTDAGTRLTFTEAFGPGEELEANDDVGGDQPAGPGSPWRPGFVAGFHGMLDELGDFLDGRWTEADRAAHLEAHRRGEPPAQWLRMIEVYREHIRRTCPR